MFFYLSKIFGFFIIPSNFLIALGLLGLLLMATRFARMGKRFLAASVILFAGIGFLPVGTILLLPLEQRFPSWSDAEGAPDGIVVLGGPISPELSQARGEISLGGSAERLTIVATLARRFPNARIIFSGGNGALINPQGSEAEFALKLFESFGIDRARITSEGRSRNTIENAEYSKQLADPKPGESWLLVTSAYHMPRSIGVFRRAGFDVQAYPVDYQTRGWDDMFEASGSINGGVGRMEAALHEWIGLLAYWATGRSSEFFPGPKK